MKTQIWFSRSEGKMCTLALPDTFYMSKTSITGTQKLTLCKSIFIWGCLKDDILDDILAWIETWD
jgi:hypothetical protein